MLTVDLLLSPQNGSDVHVRVTCYLWECNIHGSRKKTSCVAGQEMRAQRLALTSRRCVSCDWCDLTA